MAPILGGDTLNSLSINGSSGRTPLTSKTLHTSFIQPCDVSPLVITLSFYCRKPTWFFTLYKLKNYLLLPLKTRIFFQAGNVWHTILSITGFIYIVTLRSPTLVWVLKTVVMKKSLMRIYWPLAVREVKRAWIITDLLPKDLLERGWNFIGRYGERKNLIVLSYSLLVKN